MGGYRLYEENGFFQLISLGDITLSKNKVWKSVSGEFDDVFNYHEIQKALCGDESNQNGNVYFTATRLLIIQMQ